MAVSGSKILWSHVRWALPPPPDLKKKDVAGGVERPAEHPVDERVAAHRRHRAVPWEDYRWHCVAKSADDTLRWCEEKYSWPEEEKKISWRSLQSSTKHTGEDTSNQASRGLSIQIINNYFLLKTLHLLHWCPSPIKHHLKRQLVSCFFCCAAYPVPEYYLWLIDNLWYGDDEIE